MSRRACDYLCPPDLERRMERAAVSLGVLAISPRSMNIVLRRIDCCALRQARIGDQLVDECLPPVGGSGQGRRRIEESF